MYEKFLLSGSTLQPSAVREVTHNLYHERHPQALPQPQPYHDEEGLLFSLGGAISSWLGIHGYHVSQEQVVHYLRGMTMPTITDLVQRMGGGKEGDWKFLMNFVQHFSHLNGFIPALKSQHSSGTFEAIERIIKDIVGKAQVVPFEFSQGAPNFVKYDQLVPIEQRAHLPIFPSASKIHEAAPPHHNNSSLQSRPPSPSNINSRLRLLLQKKLRITDVGSGGRIGLPKKVAEANLSELQSNGGIMMKMKDLETSHIWHHHYRLLQYNNTKTYVLDNTKKFVKTHNLQSGDYMMIYEDQITKEKVIRAKKAAREQPQSSSANVASDAQQHNAETKDVNGQETQQQNCDNEDVQRKAGDYSNVDNNTPPLSSEELPPHISKPEQEAAAGNENPCFVCPVADHSFYNELGEIVDLSWSK